MAIETSAQWWHAVEHNWDDLVALLSGESQPGPAGLDRMRRQRDARITARLLAARRRAPARRLRRDHHGWQVLFDLCAEQWVLHQPIG